MQGNLFTENFNTATLLLRHVSRNKEQRTANLAEKNPMTLVRIEPGPPGYKSNALPLSQRVYSLKQLSEIGYKPIRYV